MTTTVSPTPTWLVHPCPEWCVREHAQGDHPEDRRHQSAEEVVVVVRGHFPGAEGTDPDAGPHAQEDWLVVAHGPTAGPPARPAVETAEWVHLGQVEVRAGALDLTRDSAERLRDALTQCLDATD